MPSTLRVIFSTVAAVALSGCIAGAATDSSAYVYEAQHYPEFMASSVSKSASAVTRRSPRLPRDQLLSLMSNRSIIRQERVTKQYVTVGNLKVSFFEQAISVRNGEDEVLSTAIPKVFYYSDLQMATHSVGDQAVTAFLAYSRQTTSMVWLAIYDANWKPLYRAVLPLHKVWSIQPRPDGITIDGSAYSEQVRLFN